MKQELHSLWRLGPFRINNFEDFQYVFFAKVKKNADFWKVYLFFFSFSYYLFSNLDD